MRPSLRLARARRAGGTAEERASRRRTDSSILDWITDEVARLKQTLGPTDRNRLNDYLDDVREIERRIQRIELQNTSGEPRELPEAPIGVPDSFREHVEVMFDLQALAFMSDLTRVFSFKMGRDASGRAYPESGTTRGFHPASHHGEREERVLEFATIIAGIKSTKGIIARCLIEETLIYCIEANQLINSKL